MVYPDIVYKIPSMKSGYKPHYGEMEYSTYRWPLNTKPQMQVHLGHNNNISPGNNWNTVTSGVYGYWLTIYRGGDHHYLRV